MRAIAFPTTGLAVRVLAAALALVAVVLATALLLATAGARRGADAAARQELEQAADLTAQLLAGRGRSLAGGARVFVQGPYFRALVAERRRDDILDQAFEASEQLEADWVFITDERGALLAKSDEPGAFGDQLGSLPLVAGALDGRVMSGFGVSRDSVLFQTVAVPIIVPGAAPVGVLVATRLVDERLARDIRAATGTDVVFFALAEDGRATPSAATLDASVAARAAALLAAAPAEAGAPPELRVGDGRWAVQRASLATAGGDVVGGFVVLTARVGTPPGVLDVRRALVAAAALGLLLALALAALAGRRLGQPASALASAARRAARGDLDAAASIADAAAVDASGELAELGAALAGLLGELRDRRRLADVAVAAAEPTDAVPARPVPAPASSGRGARIALARAAPALHARAAPRIGAGLAAGDELAGRYLVEAEIGAGGNGVVYRALDRALGEHVAVKVLRPELVADEPRAAEALAHELRLARRISHRNVVRTHDLGESGGLPFITMELVDGASLAAVLRARGPLDEPAILAVAAQLARALEAAHAEGVVHGDLKPGNVLLARDGVLKVGDFGVASLARWRAGEAAASAPASGARRRLAGAVVGTPEYLAPEVLLGGAPDVRADLYAAGMVLHECATGATPFEADTPRSFLARKLDAPPPDADAEDEPSAGPPRTLRALVAQLTARDRERRPTCAAELAEHVARLARATAPTG